MNQSDSAADSEVLTEGEVQKLLAQVQPGEIPLASVSAATKPPPQREEIQTCDFRQAALLNAGEMRKLRLRHEDFIRSLAARLSMHLRLEVTIQMARLQTILYDKLTAALPTPTHLTLFKAEPLRGICLLEVPPRLGLTVVDRLLGGPAQSVDVSRDLSEIEVALLDQVCGFILGEWCGLWTKMQELRPVIIGHENNSRFLQCAAHDTAMLCVAMEVRLGDCAEQIQLALPYSTIEHLIKQLGDLEETDKTRVPPAAATPRWNRILDDIPVRVSAEWHGLELTARELSQLKAGDVVLLDPACADMVAVKLEGIPKYHGRLGTRFDKWAVEIKNTHPT